LQGQVTVSAVLTTVESFPDEAEFFLVFRGSSLEHITEAQKSCFVNTLHFVVPGHNMLEDVSITAYIYTEGTSLLYVEDEAHELAQFLVEHSHCLSRTSHQEVIARFGLLEENRRRKTDEKVTMAMANFEFPYTWNILGSQAGEEPKPRESLLHLAVRLGLISLSQFLLCQPGGLMALSLPNEEGVTPLQLAKQSGHQALVELLTNPPNPLVTPLAGISQIQADGSRLLKFCHLSETLTLTVRPDPERTLESDILLLRKRLKDNNFLREVKALGLEGEYEWTEDSKDLEKLDASKSGCQLHYERIQKVLCEILVLFPKHLKSEMKRIYSLLGGPKSSLSAVPAVVFESHKNFCGGDRTLIDSVFEEPLVLSVDDDEEHKDPPEKEMDSDSDSPFNYSWPSFPKMRIRRRSSKQGTGVRLAKHENNIKKRRGGGTKPKRKKENALGKRIACNSGIQTGLKLFNGIQSGRAGSARPKQTSQPVLMRDAQLSAVLNGKDEIYANSMLVDKVDDLDIKYSIDGVTTESTQTDSCASDLRQGRLSHSGVHFPEEAGSSACCNHISEHCGDERHTSNNAGDREQFPSVSLANLALARLNQPHRPHVFNKEGSPPQNSTCTLSPNLVALEVDSEDDDTLDKSPLSQASTSPQSIAALQPSSADEQDSFDTSPELSSSRARSSSSHTSTLSKAYEVHSPQESGDPGIRLRSYSYSSPKISLSRPRFSRDTNISDLTEDGVFNSSGRSLLQALSLSKSMSLLNPVKQRAFSLPEHPREKRELSFRKRAQSAEDEGSAELADSLQHLTLSEFLKEIEEEEWDKYIIPSKSESEKYKVSRTFSFLKSRMSSTRSKNKGKNKDKEGKEKLVNGHQFLAGSCSGLTLCLVCDKPAIGKELLQCSNCTINVHKGCRDSCTPCLKKLQDKYGVTVKSKTASLPLRIGRFARTASSTREIPHYSGSLNTSSPSLPVMMAKDTKREQSYQAHPLSKSASAVTERRLSEGMEADGDSSGWRGRSQSEEILQVMGTSPSTDSFVIEDTVDVPLRSDFSADLLDYEAESWSLYVDPKFCSKQEKRIIKRQDVIYELMQTEMHHIQTLTIMSEIFRRGMKEQLQLDHYTVDKIFPCLDELFDIHKSFFSAMKERRQHGTEENNDRNFLIDRIGDVLVQQFSDENAMKMKQVYGEFCSHHTEAVNFFKELQQQNKKFQAFIKQQSNNSLVRRREIPECILLVTQRITKYPVLVERILQHSKEGTEEHADLIRALSLIREVIAAVDLKVSEYEKEQKLVEILNRIENKTFAKLKNGHTFRKQDLMSQGRTLQHDGLVYWKTATGRLKDIMALLLTDVLIFLQEKDQKYIFATVDQKPPVISLQKLIVREVANEERGMFLISASSAGPEMYEIHTVLVPMFPHSCPEEEEERTSETEEDRRAAEARAQKIQKFQETLINQDQQICNSLEEKLRIYAELTGMSVNEESAPDPHLLIRPDPEEVPQAAVLLAAALREAEKLTAALTSQSWSSDSQSQESVAEPSSPGKLKDFGTDNPNTQSSSSVSLTSDSEMREGEWSGDIYQSPTEVRRGDATNINLKVVQSVQSLTQLLYSLQAAVTIQDSCYEVQKLILQENERLPRLPSSRGNLLQEQEKQRNLEKQREELAGAQRLQNQLRQEQQRWERECELRQRQQGEKESQLEHRERDCHLQAEQLQHDREELEAQLREYQHSLERLREGQQLVEKEREKLETQQRLLQGWRHNRQRSLPVMMIPLDSNQGTSHSRSESFDGDGSVFVNEAALQMSLNNHHRTSSLVYTNNPSAHNNLNSVIARTNDKQSNQGTDFSYNPLGSSQSRRTTTARQQIPLYTGSSTGGHGDRANNDINTHHYSTDRPPPEQGMSGSSFYHGYSQSPPGNLLTNPQTYISLEPENGEDDGEENIVYL
ncbi:ARG28 factor, partial [Atractosteus spatula]|nr:ARG28 factor [Atractosteus spatula]